MSHFIGSDVSKATQDCAWLRDPDQDKAKRKRCRNEPRSFESLTTSAEASSGLPRQSLDFVIEPTHIYHEQLVQFLDALIATDYLVNPGRVRKFAEGIGILSKYDVIDAVLLVRYGLMARKLIAYAPAPQEMNDLRNLLNRLDVLKRNCRKVLSRLEKAGRSATFHRLEQQSIRRSVKHHKTEIATFRNAVRQCVNATPWLQRDVELLGTVPGLGEKTAWFLVVILSSRQFKSPPEVASFLGLNPVEKRSGQSEYRKPRLSKSGSARYRQALYFHAMVATRKNPDVQARYERLVAAGKPRMCALGAAMRKLVHIAFGVYKNQQPCQPRIDLSSTPSQQSPVWIRNPASSSCRQGSAQPWSHSGASRRNSVLLSADSKKDLILVEKEDGIYTLRPCLFVPIYAFVECSIPVDALAHG